MRIRLQGYAGDCTVAGDIELDGVRLSDALDRLDELVLHDATLHSLADGRQVEMPEVALQREDLFAVEGPGAPPGEGQRRVRMVRHLLQLRMGPYTCFGELHSLPGVAPLRTLLVRRTMVPLTDCVLAFTRNGQQEVRRVPLLVVNASHIDRVEEVSSAQIESEVAQLGAVAAATSDASSSLVP